MPNVQRFLRSGLDVVVLVIAWVGAFQLRFEGAIPGDQMHRLLMTLPYVIGLKLTMMSLLALGRHSWRYFALRQASLLARAIVVSSMFILAARLFGDSGTYPFSATVRVPFSVIGADMVLSLLGLLAIRAGRRIQSEEAEARSLPVVGMKRVILIGAGRAGVLVARELKGRPDVGLRPIGFLDDDRAKLGEIIMGVPVLGAPEDLGEMVRAGRVDEVIITIAGATGAEVRRLTDIVDGAGLEAKIIPGVYEILSGHVDVLRLRPVEIEDLLRREPVELDLSGIAGVIAGRPVAVTGAGGSIGSELCRQLAHFGPSKIVLIEQAEPAMWAIHRELDAAWTTVEIVPAIADVCDADRVTQVLTQHRPAVVFHAAAHKHVPMMEWNPGEAIKNNVFGTKTVADASLATGVERFVMISTDKAVNPTSVMGATKRIAERYVQHLAVTTGKPFVSVRFGNVLGSTGSVVPIFKEQIARGGPVTVTHPDMVRYFMTIPEAAQLVIQAAALGTAGEIFVLDMGEPVKIVDLARDIIRLSGLEPDEDIQVEFTGLRPGEKMFEELSLSDESATRTTHPQIWVGQGDQFSWDDVDSALAQLVGASFAAPESARQAIVDHVPEIDVLAVDLDREAEEAPAIS